MKFNKTVLKNGLRVVTIPMPDNPSVTVLVMVETGSKYETKRNNGISHFLEHMVFKGTTKRPKASDISRELDSVGAHYNAFTGHEYTGYYVKADARHFDMVLDIVSDMFVDPLFDQNEIDKEKGVIVEEIRMYQDVPQSRAQDAFMRLMYGDQPIGWHIAGTEANVKSFSRADFVSYRDAHYVSGATTVLVAGNIDERSCIAKVESAFARLSSSPKAGKEPVRESQTAPKIEIDRRETDQTHLVIGVRTFGIKDPRIPTMKVLTSVLGGGMSSRLFSRLRDDLGICYYVKGDHDPLTDHGMFTVSAGVDNTRVDEGIREILAQLKRLKDEPVPQDELKKVKDHIAGSAMLGLETSDDRAEFAGGQEVLKGTIESPDEIIAKIEKVTVEDIQRLAREIFVDEHLNMAIVGKYDDKDVKRFEEYFKL